MRKFSMAGAVCALGMMLLVSGCYAGGKNVVKPGKDYVTQKVSLTDIESIRSSSSVDVVYTQASGTPYAEIYAPDNIVPLVRVEQKGKSLYVGFKPNTSISGHFKCEVHVYAPEVTSFATSSSSDITLTKGLKTQKDVSFRASSSGDITVPSVECAALNLSASSSGDIELNTARCSSAVIDAGSAGDCTVKDMVCSGDVKASTSSSGDITLAGTCRNAVFSASSAGDIYAKDLLAKDVKAEASSAGDIECHPSGVLSTSVSSAGNVRYKGEPVRIEGKIKGVSKM